MNTSVNTSPMSSASASVPQTNPTLTMNTPPTMPPATAQASTSAPSQMSGKKFPLKYIIAAVLLVVLVAGGGVALYASQQSQETRQQAYEPPTVPPDLAKFEPETPPPADLPSPTPSPDTSSLTPNDLTVIAGSISGKICRDTVKDSGAVFFFNTKRNTVQFLSVDKTAATFSKKLIPGVYAVEFQSDTTHQPLGYTDVNNNLQLVPVDVRQDVKSIDLCDPKAVSPGGNFQPETLTL